MCATNFLAREFEANRDRLRAVAYRMLGSANEAEDAVQETWIRLSRGEGGEIGNLSGWLTTVVGRICLDILRRRSVRREERIADTEPLPAAGTPLGRSAEDELAMADSVALRCSSCWSG